MPLAHDKQGCRTVDAVIFYLYPFAERARGCPSWSGRFVLAGLGEHWGSVGFPMVTTSAKFIADLPDSYGRGAW